MAGLGETLKNLSRRESHQAPREARLRRTTAFGNNPGALTMLSYLPAGLPAGAPLVVLLHGCTQTAEAHAAASGWLDLADRLGFAVLAPQQVAGNNPSRCFNWFEPGDIQRGQGEAASIHAMVISMVAKHALDVERVFVSGLSAGGAMAAVMLATYPETFAGGAIVAGLPYGVAHSAQEAMGAMRGGTRYSTEELAARVRAAAPAPQRRPRICIWHGDADHTVSPAAADQLASQWLGVHGLQPAPDVSEVIGQRTRRRWLTADGDVLVEQNTIRGLGHGVPLATHGEAGVGFAAPFMLEVGVSSALLTASFWGLSQEAAAQEPEVHAQVHEAPEPHTGLGASVLATTARHVPARVQEVIARALEAAGLVR